MVVDVLFKFLSKPIFPVMLGACLVLIISYSLWQSYESPSRDIPIIRVNNPLPVRVPPEDEGGTEVEHRGLLVFDVLDGIEHQADIVMENPSQTKSQEIGRHVMPLEGQDVIAMLIKEQQNEASIVSDMPSLKGADPNKAIPLLNQFPHDFGIQIGAFKSFDTASRSARTVQRNEPSLANLKLYLVRAEHQKTGLFYRAILGPVSDQKTAFELCDILSKSRINCVVVGGKI